MILMKHLKDALTFGKKLAVLRKQKGISQAQLAKMVKVSRRVIAYYEAEADNLPARLIRPLAEALHVSVDELVGIKPIKESMTKEEIALWKRFKKAQTLSVRNQKAIFHLLHALLKKN